MAEHQSIAIDRIKNNPKSTGQFVVILNCDRFEDAVDYKNEFKK
jgi:hypothetical protein